MQLQGCEPSSEVIACMVGLAVGAMILSVGVMVMYVGVMVVYVGAMVVYVGIMVVYVGCPDRGMLPENEGKQFWLAVSPSRTHEHIDLA